MSAWDAAGWAATALLGLMALTLAAIPLTLTIGWWTDRRRARAADRITHPEGPLNRRRVRQLARQITTADDDAIWTEIEGTP